MILLNSYTLIVFYNNVSVGLLFIVDRQVCNFLSRGCGIATSKAQVIFYYKD
jgi:nicotinate-nucleotide pyrophosphorylase